MRRGRRRYPGVAVMTALALYLVPSALLLAWLCVAAVVTRGTQRPALHPARGSFALAYVHRDDVARFAAEGWHEVGVDPRYGSVIMRRDGGDTTAPDRGVVLGRGA